MANKTIALEASDASISTATISIKVVQVGKRQLTQSTFKQLPSVDLVDEDRVLLTGVPWGHVRYHWGDQGRSATHFIVQNGMILNRSLFLIRNSDEFRGGLIPKGYQSLGDKMQLLCEAQHRASILDWCGDKGFIRDGDVKDVGQFTVAVEGIGRFSSRFDYPSVLMESYARHYQPKNPYGDPESKLIDERSQKKAELRSRIYEIAGPDADTQSLKREMLAIKATMLDYRRRWDELMEKLRTVEQLFIAT